MSQRNHDSDNENCTETPAPVMLHAGWDRPFGTSIVAADSNIAWKGFPGNPFESYIKDFSTVRRPKVPSADFRRF